MPQASWIDLSDRVALVTGAASGIGRATALALADAGATVLALDLDEGGAKATVAAIEAASGSATARALDVTAATEWKEASDWIAQTWGRIDILVNSAGVALSDRAGDEALETYHRSFAINVEGSLLGMGVALRFMRASGKGAIVNLSSTASLKGNPIMASYGASKAAIAHYTRSVALELARESADIRVNSVHPGLIETAMAQDFYQIYGRLGAAESVVKMATTGRAGRPDEVADLILFLVSDRASFISGSAIVIDRAHSA